MNGAILYVVSLLVGVLPYAWKDVVDPSQAISARIQPPPAYMRHAVDENSFAAWLRGLPLKPGKPGVKLYNGALKNRQDVHVAVVDMDVGTRDLQQCADAVIRLRSEYLYSKGSFDSIRFDFNNGFAFDYAKWSLGHRVKISGNRTTWTNPATPKKDNSYKTFRSYLTMAFGYCGSLSLSKEMNSISVSQLQPGDVFIRGGSPGHAVMVMDVAVNGQGKKVFLPGQSYMPAQEFHILMNPNDSKLSPWYEAVFIGQLVTPEWIFSSSDLKRF